jgi:hypothetical protein
MNLLYINIMLVITIELILAFSTDERVKHAYDNNFAYGDFNPPLTAFRIRGANGALTMRMNRDRSRNVAGHPSAGRSN